MINGQSRMILSKIKDFNPLFTLIGHHLTIRKFEMNCQELEQLYKLSPKITTLTVRTLEDDFTFILNFKELKELKIMMSENNEVIIKLLESLKDDNKIEILIYDYNVDFGNPFEDEEYKKYLETLFKKVKLTEFKRSCILSCFDEENIISSWIKKSSTIEKIDFNCNYYFKLF
jgi:hypothetical protein